MVLLTMPHRSRPFILMPSTTFCNVGLYYLHILHGVKKQPASHRLYYHSLLFIVIFEKQIRKKKPRLGTRKVSEPFRHFLFSYFEGLMESFKLHPWEGRGVQPEVKSDSKFEGDCVHLNPKYFCNGPNFSQILGKVFQLFLKIIILN